ncbi:hypothetical protein CPB84DRAFT_1795908 [Gymnopilus junonius]|uniref:Uncharacterized protein n=1 Tax=Gymnopilus junonius TaxID=109634 RepID=A0A9P5TGX3_GYMJU|nr:hypothetical protein CPB84DRAFT_1795908 [Gymnopilus junonius]
MDSSGEQRAANLLKVLSQRKNIDLVSSVQALSLTFPPTIYNAPPAPNLSSRLRPEVLYSKLRRTLQDVCSSITPKRKAQVQLLDISCQAPLTALSIIGENDAHRWDPRLDTLLLRIFLGCSSNLKCLHVVNVWNIPKRELKLAHSSFERIEQTIASDNVVSNSISAIWTLQITYIMFPDLLRVFRNSFGSRTTSPQVTFPMFPYLKTLKLSFPNPYRHSLEELMHFISCETPCLETLEFCGDDLDSYYSNLFLDQVELSKKSRNVIPLLFSRNVAQWGHFD